MPVILSFIEKIVAVILATYFLPGIQVEGFWNVVLLALVLGLLNVLVKPVLFIVTLPLNIVTLGLFNIVINTVIVLLADYLMPGFNLDSFFYGFLLVIVLWIVDMIFHMLFGID